MDPRIKLSKSQMNELLDRHLQRAGTQEPMKQPVMPSFDTSGMPPMPAPMSSPMEQPVTPSLPTTSQVEEKAAPPTEITGLVGAAENLYKSMMMTGPLSAYWQSVVRLSPEAKSYKDPELFFISMFIQRAKDPVKFATTNPDISRLFDKLTDMPVTGAANPSNIDPIAIYDSISVGNEGGMNSGTPRTNKW